MLVFVWARTALKWGAMDPRKELLGWPSATQLWNPSRFKILPIIYSPSISQEYDHIPWKIDTLPEYQPHIVGFCGHGGLPLRVLEHRHVDAGGAQQLTEAAGKCGLKTTAWSHKVQSGCASLQVMA